MEFPSLLRVNTDACLRALGVPDNEPAAGLQTPLYAAAHAVETAASPRWTYQRFSLDSAGHLAEGLFTLPGSDIRRHLAGCDACVLLALTLGASLDQAILAAERTDMQAALLMDTAASTLAEQYADAASAALCTRFARQRLFLTGRYSPGYGDLPLGIQPDFIRLLNAQRAIGLTCTASHILAPRKSITAVLGLAAQPVAGIPTGCAACPMNGSCTRQGK